MDKKFKIGYTTGVYDMLHIGHLNIFKRAKKECDYLIVGVTTDELSYIRKNKYPIINQEERVEIIKAIKYVDKVILQEDMDKLKKIIDYKVDVVFVGSDWQGTEQWEKYEKEFKEFNCEVIYLPHTDGISSTILKEKLKKEMIK